MRSRVSRRPAPQSSDPCPPAWSRAACAESQPPLPAHRPRLRVKSTAFTTASGPSRLPTAAISFTSPAPVAPSTCPGSMSTRPITHPSTAAPTDTPPKPNAASPRPAPAIVPVRTLGIRRVRRSTTVATSRPAISTASDALAAAGDDLPEHRVDGVSNRRDGSECDKGNERAEQRVLEKILTVLLAAQPRVREALQPGNSNWRWHDSTPPVDPAKRWAGALSAPAHDRSRTTTPPPRAGRRCW